MIELQVRYKRSDQWYRAVIPDALWMATLRFWERNRGDVQGRLWRVHRMEAVRRDLRHRVSTGETLRDVARKHGVTPKTLHQWRVKMGVDEYGYDC